MQRKHNTLEKELQQLKEAAATKLQKNSKAVVCNLFGKNIWEAKAASAQA